MIIGERLRSLRAERDMSQGDIEERTGLLRCYISRVENGHTVPAVETLEKFARALGIPIYQLFYEDGLPNVPAPLKRDEQWGSSGRDRHTLTQFRRTLASLNDDDRALLLYTARKMAEHKKARRPRS